MGTVTSTDGTTIAFDRSGTGPVLILVGGIFEQRAMDSETAQLGALPLLAEHFTVIHYDRRGRGDSTDTQPYAVGREVEAIETLIDGTSGSAFLAGTSSGGALALEAALALGGKVTGLAMYEPPYNCQRRPNIDPLAPRRHGVSFQATLTTTTMMQPSRHGGTTESSSPKRLPKIAGETR
jgi:pimeloyl-ACP methyl ester carboxylesterase